MKRAPLFPTVWVAILVVICVWTGVWMPVSGANGQPPDDEAIRALRAQWGARARLNSDEVPPIGNSDLTITPATAVQLAQAIVGAGITLTGTPVFVGRNEQAGTFTAFTTGPWTNPVTGQSGNISIPSGVIFSSGFAANANAPYDGAGSSVSIGGPGDADLEAIAGAPTLDATSLTFQFIPNGTAISFGFVFASTEYPNFVGSGFFDAIAIKVNNVNVAVIPGTTTPVNVNTINLGKPTTVPPVPASRPDLFTNYSTVTPATPFNYGGATVLLSGTAPVTPGVANTIKIAVGDTGDTQLDSAIFLQGASLQACTYSISPPTTVNFAGAGGTASATVNTQPGCRWTATANNGTNTNFISITNPAGGNGAGPGTINYSVGLSNVASRSGTITVQGQGQTSVQTLTINQNRCFYSIPAGPASVGAGGGPGSFGVSTTAGCSWSAVSNNTNFITLTPPTGGAGSGTVNYNVASGPAVARSGSITVTGELFTQSYTINQAACSYSLAPPSATFAGAGGNASATVTTQTGCGWSTVVNNNGNTNFISLTSGGVGPGSGPINYSVGQGPVGTRTGSIVVSPTGQAATLTLAITQNRCGYTIPTTPASFTAAGGPGSFGVTTTTGCSWTATSNNTNFITVSPPGGGTGTGTVNYTVGSGAVAPRSGTITVAGELFSQNFTINQSACTYSLSPPTASYGGGGGPGSATVTTQTGCAWGTSITGFVAITSGASGTGSGTINYNVPGSQLVDRTHTITLTVNGQPTNQVLTITQKACTFIVTPNARQVTAEAGTGSFAVTAVENCVFTAINNTSWLRAVPNAGPYLGSSTVNYSYDANPDPVVRTARLTLGGTLGNGLYFFELTQLASTASTRLTAGGTPEISGNSRFLAFATAAPLDAVQDTNSASDIYVFDRTNGSQVRVSLGQLGEQGNGGSFAPAMSADGRFVAFESDASTLVPNDTNGVRDVFLRDRDADGDGIFDEAGSVTTRLVSRGSPSTLNGVTVEGNLGQAASRNAAISADGSLIAFASDANNLVFNDTNNQRDVFVHIRADKKVYRVSLTSTLLQGPGASDRPSVNGNGKIIAFESDSALTADDTNAFRDVYVFNWNGAPAPAFGAVSLKSLPAGGTAAGDSTEASISDDGTLVAFVSVAKLVLADGNAGADIYVRGATTSLVSRNAAGQAVGGSSGPAVSGDGKAIAFATTAAGLSPADGNGVDDVYIQNQTTGEVRLVSAAGATAGSGRSFDPSISDDGLTIAFATLAVLPAVQTEDDRTVSAIASAEPGEVGIAISAPLPQVNSLTASGVVAPDHGPANQQTPVQIVGRHLYGITDVKFGNVAGIGIQISADGNTLDTKAPAQPAGTVAVRVANLVSTGIEVDQFTYDTNPPCAYQLNAGSTSIGAGGTTTSLTVTVQQGVNCGWNLTENVDWLSVQPASGIGTGTVQVTIVANGNPPERSAKIELNAQSITFTQAGSGCTDLIKPASRAREVSPGAGTDNGVEIETAPGCAWTAGADVPWLHPPASGIGSATVLYSIDPNPGPSVRQGTLTVQGPATSANIIVTQLAPPPPVNCAFTPNPASLKLGTVGGARTVTISAGPGCAWTAKSDVSWITLNAQPSGVGNGNIQLTIDKNSGADRAGTVTLNINVTGPNAPKLTVTEDGERGQAPFGVVDTPGNSVTLNGSVPLTGWALDDKNGIVIQISAQEQAANAPVFLIGNAIRVKGARTDIQGLYPTSAESDLAGWGYLLLSNQIPNLRFNGSGFDQVGVGNGTFKLIFKAIDTDGLETPLGERIVTFNNGSATAPFGGIDTPGQGAEISGGNYAQFGWALTPQPKAIATDGSTIKVFIDGVSIGSPTYGLARSDISTLFPGLNNSAGPVGLFGLNTLVLANGVHTISWNVTDNGGVASGIGSRFFTVNNSGVGITPTETVEPVFAASVRALPASSAAVRFAHGLNDPLEALQADETGTRHVEIHALDIVRFALAGATEGYSVNGDTLEALPIGSTFDPAQGTFAWQLGPGFLGVYNLVFVRDVNGARERVPIRIVVHAETDEMALNAPVSAGAARNAAGRQELAGTVASGDALALREVMVYAYPRGGAGPIVVGSASVEAGMGDVARPRGGQFDRSAFSMPLDSLPPGTYDLLVVARSGVSAALDSSTWVRGVTIK